MNNQPIEKRRHTVGELDVHSIFRTIQGEGPFSGAPAIFIRLAGCNLQCPACDTDYTSKRTTLTHRQIAEEVCLLEHFKHAHLVVITGGEPFRQNLVPLINSLLALGFYVQIETNGTLEAPDGIEFSLLPERRYGAYIVCSPKTGKVHPSIERSACAYKYVLSADSVSEKDGLPIKALLHPASPQVARPPSWWNRAIYVQPLDVKCVEGNLLNNEATVASCMTFGYTLQLQIHKILNLE